MKRTQIYLSEEQWRDLERAAQLEDTSVAELIRRAVDRTYRTGRISPAAIEAWERMGGLWADREDIDSAEACVRDFRRDDRLERLYPQNL